MSKKWKVHPVAALFPMMSESEIQDLSLDIAEHGQKFPVVLHDGVLIDGRNRLAACELAGVEPEATEWEPREGETVEDWIVSVNGKRRHWTESQRAMTAAGFAIYLRTKFERGEGASVAFQKVAAKTFSVSERSVQDAERILRDGAKDLQEAVRANEISVSAGAQITTAPKAKQSAAVKDGKHGVSKLAKEEKDKRPRREPSGTVGAPQPEQGGEPPPSANLRMRETEPEQPPEATPPPPETADANGREIPESLRPVWAVLHAKAPEAGKALRHARKAVTSLLNDSLEAAPSDWRPIRKSPGVALQNALRALDELAEHCDRLRPHVICPACLADPKKRQTCAKCGETGWLDKADKVQAERREEKGKAAMVGAGK